MMIVKMKPELSARFGEGSQALNLLTEISATEVAEIGAGYMNGETASPDAYCAFYEAAAPGGSYRFATSAGAGITTEDEDGFVQLAQSCGVLWDGIGADNTPAPDYVRGNTNAVFTPNNQIVIWSATMLADNDGERWFYFQEGGAEHGKWVSEQLTWDAVVARAHSIDPDGYHAAIEEALDQAPTWARS